MRSQPETPANVFTPVGETSLKGLNLRHQMGGGADSLMLRQVLSVVPEAIVLVSRSGQVQLVNDQAVELFGRPESELVGELIGFSVEEGHMSEVEILNHDGVRIAELRVASVEWNGEPAHIASLRDVTLLRAQEAELRRAQKMEALGRVAGGVAHDFNNLLFAIMTYANVVRDSLSDKDPRREDMEQILSTAVRSRELIAKLLAFARGRPATPVTVDPAAAILSIAKTLGPTMPDDIQFEAKVAEDLWSVRMDPVELDQLLINLLVNARDAIDGAGVVTIVADNVTHRDRRSAEAHPYVRVRVRDSGCGIDPRIADKIFEPFFTTKPLNVGTGLGLAACHGIIRDAGGSISFDSAPGKGTEFEILLPRAEVVGSDESDPTEPGVAEGHAANPVILLVEDEPVVRLAIARALRGCDFTVVEAEGTDDAIRKLTTLERCDLVLSDIRMPGEDGVSLAKRVRSQWPGIRVVLMSGYSPDVAMDGLTAAGVGMILPKPFAVDVLVSRLNTELGRALATA